MSAWTDLYGCTTLRFPEFLDWYMKVGSLLALRTGRVYPLEKPLVLIFVKS
jgi:hypothetical protein